MKNYEIIQQGDRTFILLTGPWSNEVAIALRNHGISDLRLSHYTNWHETSVHFLEQVPFLERLDLWATGIKDISPLYTLKNLKNLSLNQVKPAIDFSRFPLLRRLSVGGVRRKIDFTAVVQLTDLELGNWDEANFSSVFELRNLESLSITGFSDKNLLRLQKLKSLKRFGLGQSLILSLSGADNWPELETLSLVLANQLTSFKGLGQNISIAYLSIEGAKKLSNIDDLRQLINLRTLILTRCPGLRSLRGVTGLKKLETICLLETTKIGDGDFEMLKALPALKHVSFVDRPGYSRRNAEFPKAYRFGVEPLAPSSTR